MHRDASYWIQALNLQSHPEGGYYRQTYRADLLLQKEALPKQFTGPRAACTAIYFLLQGADFSAFHRLRSDELWHFYSGTTLIVHILTADGQHLQIRLGPDPEAGEQLQAVVRAESWFASDLKDKNSFALVGCTVSPGFDFDDFELARRSDLIDTYPQHRELIEHLTRT